MSFQITILGTGSATPLLIRNPTAQVLTFDSDCYLIDCGEGTQVQLLRYKIKQGKLKYIFISHLHGDHYFGLIGLLTSLGLAQRQNDLYVFGPEGLAEVITLQLKVSDTRLGFSIHFHEIQPNERYICFENDYLTVETIPLQHRIPCSGYLFREKPKKRKILKDKLPLEGLSREQLLALKNGEDILDTAGNLLRNKNLTVEAGKVRSYAFCSDTIYDEGIVSQIKEVDILYHEATFLHELHERATKTYHTTAKQAATIALNANVKQLIIGHFSSRYKDVQPLLEEAKRTFDATLLAQEGETYLIA